MLVMLGMTVGRTIMKVFLHVFLGKQVEKLEGPFDAHVI